MAEALRMLDGENWADIQAERCQRQQLLTGGLVVALLFLLPTAMTALRSR